MECAETFGTDPDLSAMSDSRLRPVLRIESILGTVGDPELVYVKRTDIFHQGSWAITKSLQLQVNHRGPCHPTYRCGVF
ncbi:hypothetical protein PAXRUDRAFT_829687 [Paxillus rubicundulus Ve08.2h10]|uniref:Uncharacterized protein n=1 Tax=Paxillus rubicundulus Ve08.2h10 TaxID=930991 RepID=A0A0D0DUH3_9AGAM|nr:hypothetical protein PAXRUDRAFT_829687 [Paxillus rubicundulus Ve08.2h10]